jgi:DNA repair protein RecO
MSLVSTDAIILHSIDFSESDQIVCALTREKGIVNAIAKGAKRSKIRFPGTLEPFCEVVMDIFLKREGELHRLESAQLSNAHLPIREDLELLAHSTVLLELIREHLGQLDPSPATFEYLQRALYAMEPDKQWFSVWCISLMNILSSIGYGIDLKSAGNPDSRRTYAHKMLSREAAMFLLKSSRLETDVLQRLSINPGLKREITSFFLGMCNHVTDKRLKSSSFLAKLLDFDMNQ